MWCFMFLETLLVCTVNDFIEDWLVLIICWANELLWEFEDRWRILAPFGRPFGRPFERPLGRPL